MRKFVEVQISKSNKLYVKSWTNNSSVTARNAIKNKQFASCKSIFGNDVWELYDGSLWIECKNRTSSLRLDFDKYWTDNHPTVIFLDVNISSVMQFSDLKHLLKNCIINQGVVDNIRFNFYKQGTHQFCKLIF